MQEGVVTQSGKRKRGKKVVISPTSLNITTDDATCMSTPIDVDNTLFLLATSPDCGSTTCRAFFIIGSSIVGKYLYHEIDINSLTSFIIEDSRLCEASQHLHLFFMIE